MERDQEWLAIKESEKVRVAGRQDLHDVVFEISRYDDGDGELFRHYGFYVRTMNL